MKEELQNEQGDFEINLDKNFKPKKVNSEEPKPITLKTAFWGVLGVHVLALAGMGMYSTHAKAQASSIEEDRKAMSEPMPKMVGVDNPVVASATPTPTPSPSPKAKVAKVDNTKPKVEKVEVAKANPTPTPSVAKEIPNPTPKPRFVEKIPQNVNPNYPNPKFTKEYVVKKGDTFHKIVHRYGLNGEKLKKLNGIKDENKLVLGQKLKFL